MQTYIQLDAQGFPIYLGGNRHTPADLNHLRGNSLIEAIEGRMSAMLKSAQVGNAAGWRILRATTRFQPDLFPPASMSITWGNLGNADRQIGGGIVTEVETTGLPLAHTKSTEPHKVVRLYFVGTAEDVPGGEYQHEIKGAA